MRGREGDGPSQPPAAPLSPISGEPGSSYTRSIGGVNGWESDDRRGVGDHSPPRGGVPGTDGRCAAWMDSGGQPPEAPRDLQVARPMTGRLGNEEGPRAVPATRPPALHQCRPADLPGRVPALPGPRRDGTANVAPPRPAVHQIPNLPVIGLATCKSRGFGGWPPSQLPPRSGRSGGPTRAPWHSGTHTPTPPLSRVAVRGGGGWRWRCQSA